MRYVIYGAGIVSMFAVLWLWVRIVFDWKKEVVARYVKIALLVLLTVWVCWFCNRIDRYRRINNLRDRMSPLIEFSVRHALKQPGTTPEEKIEMERRIRNGMEEAIEWQIDHE